MITGEVEKTSYILVSTVDMVHIRMQLMFNEKQRRKIVSFITTCVRILWRFKSSEILRHVDW
jgi:hypothetical protein